VQRGVAAPEKFTALTPELHRYIVEHCSREGGVLAQVADETAAMGDIAVMQSAPEQAALMTLLVRAIGARRAVEVGTFTGYGAIAIARGLPEDGHLVTCEMSEEYAEIARRHFSEAGLDERIELAFGPALGTLRDLPDADFDFAYVDADKVSYPDYYEQCLRLLRSGGLVMLDNVLLGGDVLEPESREAAAVMAKLNDQIATDERVEAVMIGLSDGVTLARKR
jgi:caffeoyl-CoA O-methyltransferase